MRPVWQIESTPLSSDLDDQIERLKRCEYLKESEVRLGIFISQANWSELVIITFQSHASESL
jgi:hypothetical protein